jgi:hypothetical protein
MDSRFEVDRLESPLATGSPRAANQRAGTGATARVPAPGGVRDQRASLAAKVPPADRLSVDPLRATDRYRLVMPYAARF